MLCAILFIICSASEKLYSLRVMIESFEKTLEPFNYLNIKLRQIVVLMSFILMYKLITELSCNDEGKKMQIATM